MFFQSIRHDAFEQNVDEMSDMKHPFPTKNCCSEQFLCCCPSRHVSMLVYKTALSSVINDMSRDTREGAIWHNLLHIMIWFSDRINSLWFLGPKIDGWMTCDFSSFLTVF